MSMLQLLVSKPEFERRHPDVTPGEIAALRWVMRRLRWEGRLAELHTRAGIRTSDASRGSARAKGPRPCAQADIAEQDAAFAIDYAYAAVEDAEYAALDARLARMNADELAAGAKT